MSNRSLLEANHDFAHRVIENHEAFGAAMAAYLNSASPENAAALKRFGIKVFGMRHHSEGFAIQWGSHEASEKEDRR